MATKPQSAPSNGTRRFVENAGRPERPLPPATARAYQTADMHRLSRISSPHLTITVEPRGQLLPGPLRRNFKPSMVPS